LMCMSMDNASNNDTTTTELACILPSFLGNLWRIRCILHILNLIAKVSYARLLFDLVYYT
ncbi:hypothetical protein BT96DRAFT_839587, partial [Gymnopus androsaceus JB14]